MSGWFGNTGRVSRGRDAARLPDRLPDNGCAEDRTGRDAPGLSVSEDGQPTGHRAGFGTKRSQIHAGRGLTLGAEVDRGAS